MSNLWYCQLFGQELGPLTFEELIGHVERQQLSADDQVKLGTHGRWRPVASIGRLMAALPCQAVEVRIVPARPERLEIAEPSGSPNQDSLEAVDAVRARSVAVRTKIETMACRADGPDARRRPQEIKVSPSGQTPSPRNPSDEGLGDARLEPLKDQDSVSIASQALSPPGPSITSTAAPLRPTGSLPTGSLKCGDSGFSPSARSPVSPAQIPFSPMAAGMTRRPAIVNREASRKSVASRSRWIAEMMEDFKEPKSWGSVIALTLVLLVFGWGYLPKSRAADIRRYQTLKQLLEEIKTCRIRSPAELGVLQSKLDAVARQIANEVKKTAGRDEPAQQQLLWAARDEVPRLIQAGLSAESPAEKNLADKLQEAAYVLGLEKRPPIVFAPPVVAAEDDD